MFLASAWAVLASAFRRTAAIVSSSATAANLLMMEGSAVESAVLIAFEYDAKVAESILLNVVLKLFQAVLEALVPVANAENKSSSDDKLTILYYVYIKF
jgi:hypothetical protein